MSEKADELINMVINKTRNIPHFNSLDFNSFVYDRCELELLEAKKQLYAYIQQLEDRLLWIHVREKLPEDREDVLVEWHNGWIRICSYSKSRNRFYPNGGKGMSVNVYDCIAWLPIAYPPWNNATGLTRAKSD